MDNWLIDKFDRVGIWAQRSMGWRITDVKVHLAGLTIASNVAYWGPIKQSWGFAIFVLVIWTPHALVCWHRAKKYQDCKAHAGMQRAGSSLPGRGISLAVHPLRDRRGVVIVQYRDGL